MPLVLALALAFGNTVEMDGERWRALLAPTVEEPDPPGPRVPFRDVRIEPRDDEVRFSATWKLVSDDRKWFEARIAGPGVQIAEATFRGRSLAITEGTDGVRIAVELDGTGELVVRGVKAGDASREPVVLDLLPAAIGRVRVDTPDEPVITASGPVIALGDGIWTGAQGLAIQLTDPAPPAPRPDLASATTAVGVTVGEGAYDGRGRIRWEVRYGELSAVSFDARNVGIDLDVTGAAVASWNRSGDRVVVQLREPEDRLVELDLTWTGNVPSGDEASMAVPQLVPQAAFKTEAAITLARDGEIEVVPQLGSWTPTPFAQLPEWARGLTTQTASAIFRASSVHDGSIKLFRFTPVSAPPTFVDVATITAATTARGNVLMRAHYAVRNDRSAHMRITPPAGAQVVGARVFGETARVAIDGDTWLIPLEKSVETVEGLLSFPVEVVLLLPGDAWERKEERGLPIPRVDAPVAVTRATLYLPPGYESLLEDGDGDVVAGWTEGEGIVYGEGTGDSAEAEVLMQEAVQAWMSNEFDEADELLRELEDLGGFDENAQRLQSNLDVISGKAQGQYDVAMERRVKEQAKARSDSDKAKQEEALKEAEASYISGDYSRAEQQYRQALELGEKLDLLEQEESVELETANAELVTKLADVEKKTKNAPKKPQKVVISKDQIQIAVPDGSGLLDTEVLQKIPAGRSFQSAVEVTGTEEEERKAVEVAAARAAEEARYKAEEESRRSAGSEVRISDRTTIDFESVQIDGQLVQPQGEIVVDTRTGSHTVVLEPPPPPAATPAPAPAPTGGPSGGLGLSGVGIGGGGAAEEPGPVPVDEEPEVDEDEFVDFDGDFWADEPEPVADVLAVESRRRGIRLSDLPKSQIGGKRKGGVEGGVVGGVEGGVVGGVAGSVATSGEFSFDDLGDDDAFAFDQKERKPDPEVAKPPVRAVQMTAVIPTQGEAVRYEHLLLEAGAAYVLPIEAKSRRRDR